MSLLQTIKRLLGLAQSDFVNPASQPVQDIEQPESPVRSIDPVGGLVTADEGKTHPARPEKDVSISVRELNRRATQQPKRVRTKVRAKDPLDGLVISDEDVPFIVEGR